MAWLAEFREFAVKGNAVDMAIGIIIGAAFNRIVNSLVNDLLMPPIGWMIGNVEFKDLVLVLRGAVVTEAGQELPEVAVRYGAFLNSVIEFLIVALSAFLVVRLMNRVIRSREAEKAA